ncbi:hypothetical protein GCK72_012710 [Caenorhabditis remanei]|uniref:Uncharacterized protein n=1 Tax=Caenorhabditis remanei TaxID=31234 RepID=A0A6A5GLW0_CAERE|nr:hypothetical protein GCK72_012710 [Caenorhabditis remanei]KAF1756257.1 hypothetical protein GCK72_012710 [Caenorhabditis remanei]
MFLGSFLEHNLIWLIACYLFRYYILYVRDLSIKNLMKFLTFQVCIPIWIFLGVFFFLAMYTQNAQPDILQYSITISFMLAPVISPFAYIFFVPHYWNLCIGKKYVIPSTTSIWKLVELWKC